MRIFGRDIFRHTYDLSRFGELFNPTVLNFSFWIATAAFLFFSYQSVIPPNLEGIVNWTAGVLSATFMVFGIACIIAIFYLFITWLFGIRIHKKKTKDNHIDTIKAKLDLYKIETATLKKQLKEAESKDDGTSW